MKAHSSLVRRFSRLFLGAVKLVLSGCEGGDPTFTATTNAPLEAVADYVEDRSTDKRTIHITEGLSFALEGSDARGRPCTFDGSRTGDSGLASVRRAYGDLDQKVVQGSTYAQSSQRARTLFAPLLTRR